MFQHFHPTRNIIAIVKGDLEGKGVQANSFRLAQCVLSQKESLSFRFRNECHVAGAGRPEIRTLAIKVYQLSP
jgi:hypothetical protein